MPCQFNIRDVCNHDRATVVWVHSDALKDGKGMGLKARDEEGAFGCYACHSWIHGPAPRAEKRRAFEEARRRTRALLAALEVLCLG